MMTYYALNVFFKVMFEYICITYSGKFSMLLIYNNLTANGHDFYGFGPFSEVNMATDNEHVQISIMVSSSFK